MIVIATLGLTASALMYYYTDTRWKQSKELHIKFKKAHKYIARPVLLFGFVTTSTGLIQYQDNFKKERDYTWFIIHLVIVSIVVALAEIFNLVRHFVHKNI